MWNGCTGTLLKALDILSAEAAIDLAAEETAKIEGALAGSFVIITAAHCTPEGGWGPIKKGSRREARRAANPKNQWNPTPPSHPERYQWGDFTTAIGDSYDGHFTHWFAPENPREIRENPFSLLPSHTLPTAANPALQPQTYCVPILAAADTPNQLGTPLISSLRRLVSTPAPGLYFGFKDR